MKSAIRNLSAVGVVGLAGVTAAVVFAGGRPDGSPPAEAAETNILESVLELPDVSSEPASLSAADDVVAPELPDRGLRPALVNIEGWLQSDVSSLEELEGKVVAVQFWTLGCNNWQATLPAMQELYENYKDEGFEIVGIHAPEFSYEAELDNVVDALADLDVPFENSWQSNPDFRL